MTSETHISGCQEQTIIEKVAAVSLLRRNGAALLQQRDNKPGLRDAEMWGLPGGCAELGEPMLYRARRELRKETDCNASVLRFL